MFNGKMKALTFSYDDGVLQDRRLIEIFNKYGLKATFNLNSELFGLSGELVVDGAKVNHTKVNREEVRALYAGHEVAVHTLTHPRLTDIEDDAEIIRQVEQDRINLSELVGYEVVGMAYPCGGVNRDERVEALVKNSTGVKYTRGGMQTSEFEPSTDPYKYGVTLSARKQRDILFEKGREFLELKPDTPKVFYIWGHSYEFDIKEEYWAHFEEFCKMMSGRDDIFYGTNREVIFGK